MSPTITGRITEQQRARRYWIGTLLALPTPLRVGLVLVACCPGGTASNLVTYLARANVALSVVLTTVSTALACVVTPLLTQYLVGSVVPVNTTALIQSTMQVRVCVCVYYICIQPAPCVCERRQRRAHPCAPSFGLPARKRPD